MATSSKSIPDAPPADSTTESVLDHGIEAKQNLLRSPLRAIGFWVAVTLPFVHIPLLLSGIDTTGQLTAYLALIGLNAVGLLAGYGYRDDQVDA